MEKTINKSLVVISSLSAACVRAESDTLDKVMQELKRTVEELDNPELKGYR